MLCSDARGRLQRGDDAGALSDFDQAVSLSGGAKGEYFVQRARARARVAMRSNGREEAMAGVQVKKRLNKTGRLLLMLMMTFLTFHELR